MAEPTMLRPGDSGMPEQAHQQASPQAPSQASPPAPKRARKRHVGPTFVYLAVLKTDGSLAGTRFKIGVAIDPRERLKGVPEGEHIDWRASSQWALPTPQRAREVEAALHKALRPARLRPGHRGSGYTEWFDIAELATAQLMLQALPDMQHDSLWKPQRRPTAGRRAGANPRNPHNRPRHAPPHDPRVSAANLRQLHRVRQLWLRLARITPMQVHPEDAASPARLVLPGFKGGVLPPGHRLRMLAMGSQGIYRLQLPCGVDGACSLVTRVEYGGPERQDLQIHLQPRALLECMPDGPAILTTLGAALGTVAAMVTAREQGWILGWRPSPITRQGEGHAGLGAEVA